MKLKLDEHGKPVMQGDLPVYVHADGKEIAFDAAATVAKIGQLNGEAKSHREAKEAAEAALKTFEGLDPSKAREALQLISNIDAKKLIDAGEVEKIRSEISKAVEEKYKPYVSKSEKLELELHNEKIGGAFNRSKFISEKAAIPADLMQARFGDAFRLDDGKIVARDASGNKLYSRAKPGELADFDEALEMLIDAYPYKDSILKGSGASGSGAHNNGGAHGGKRTITRAAFDAMDPSTQQSTALAARKGEVVIAD